MKVMVNPITLNRKELKRRILNEDGMVKPNASFKEFLIYVGLKKRNKAGFMTRTYNSLYEATPYIRKVGDLEKIRKYGMGYIAPREFGKKSAEDLNRVLLKYGIKPMHWKVRTYKEVRKELEEKYGCGYSVYDILRKN